MCIKYLYNFPLLLQTKLTYTHMESTTILGVYILKIYFDQLINLHISDICFTKYKIRCAFSSFVALSNSEMVSINFLCHSQIGERKHKKFIEIDSVYCKKHGINYKAYKTSSIIALRVFCNKCWIHEDL